MVYRTRFCITWRRTRAGKGCNRYSKPVGQEHSLIALDPKQELWKITSKVCEKLLGSNKVYLLDPFNSKTHQFNPLFYIDLKEESGAKDLLKLIEILFPPYGLTGAEAHFNTSRGSTGRGWQNCFISLLTTTPPGLVSSGLNLFSQLFCSRFVQQHRPGADTQ
ncbi:type IV secretory system conjugative DNA transfer family protein [Enterobacter kobei]|uniref:type IV secretory system conjugative DNA transfer family protein n=1 Tax=Enterobacter kobei TaxID=208224 RepID=UPI00388FA144